MNSDPPPDENSISPASPPDSETGLPGLNSWRKVYLLVVVVFVVYVALMVAVERAFA